METNKLSVVSSIHCQDNELLLGTQTPNAVQVHLAHLEDSKGKEPERDFCL